MYEAQGRIHKLWLSTAENTRLYEWVGRSVCHLQDLNVQHDARLTIELPVCHWRHCTSAFEDAVSWPEHHQCYVRPVTLNGCENININATSFTGYIHFQKVTFTSVECQTNIQQLKQPRTLIQLSYVSIKWRSKHAPWNGKLNPDLGCDPTVDFVGQMRRPVSAM